MDRLDKFAREAQEEILAEARRQYSEAVIDHWMNPRGAGPMEQPDGHAAFTGPCGDTMEIFLRVADGVIVDARFVTDGCATTIASASMAVELSLGATVRDALEISQKRILRRLGGLPEENRHCAFLAECTLKAAISDYLQRRQLRVAAAAGR